MDKRLVLSICAAASCLVALSPSMAAGPRTILKTDTPRQLRRSVKDVVLAVANCQIHSLSDGKYTEGTWDQVRNIRGTSGVAWNYPWGVALYGLLRASEATDDRTFSDFVVRHDQIAGRFFVYLKWLEEVFKPEHQTELASIFNNTPLSELMKVDRLDYCGAMGAQYLEALLSQNIRAFAEDDSILDFVADYIVNRQSRLPDGTFWRPEAGQTLWIDDLYMSCPFLVRWYQHTGDAARLDDAA